MLKVTFRVDYSTHCGYCSDPTNVESTILKRKKFLVNFPHKDNFQNVTSIKSNSLDPSHQDIWKFARSNCEKREPCQIGSGYCNCGTTYKVKKLKIIEKKYLG